MASSYAPPSNDISGNPYSGTPPSDEFGKPMDYHYQVPGNN